MPRPCRFLPCCALAVLLGFFAPGLESACAQMQEDAPAGPTRASLKLSPARMILDADVSPLWIRYRFGVFQDEFADDFGVSRPLEKAEVIGHLENEIAARWVQARWYDWIHRGLAAYARFQALTETERKGFDMEVNTDDLSNGKLGVRVTRALE